MHLQWFLARPAVGITFHLKALERQDLRQRVDRENQALFLNSKADVEGELQLCRWSRRSGNEKGHHNSVDMRDMSWKPDSPFFL